MVSGEDERYGEIVRSVRTAFPPSLRRADRLAKHVEVKIAWAMRREGLTDETVVIDREARGTRDFDRDAPLTCDKSLSRFLPPGGCLRVVEADGNIRGYREGDPT
ncbi:SCP1.201-like deaminase [Amycolatopsis arida]|uniref:SCP1.201-like deaminase n=1 Tax=Amycolatopsis arida TaxID=587909 RepID=A0A1I5SSK3_9PSEU|nr:DddA-like double-stranded DNA deaminase toxin [Amycolatopsis arida]TDX96379.1 nucleic acid/nucleotide deaminase of polymorphic system toxin [Amycolatopsis arida]SFP73226.1 SCP1.201-like deaminase [Amycolatopsis arida]